MQTNKLIFITFNTFILSKIYVCYLMYVDYSFPHNFCTKY